MTSLTWENVPGPLPLYSTASDGKLGEGLTLNACSLVQIRKQNADFTSFFFLTWMVISCTFSKLHEEEEAIASVLSGILVAAISAGWEGCSIVWFNLCRTMCCTVKTLGLLQPSFLGCLSCISVPKECYRIGYLESSLRSFFISYISSSLFSEDLLGYIPGITTTTMQPTKELSRGRCVRSKKTTNFTRNADL